ncbi:MAG: HAMP domain-containing protein, partial [Mariprofundaceae bacterium]|nr:HAMP domain-containing protein [Mariprofundaceae bacterium]
MMILRGLSSVLLMWLAAIFTLVVFVGWHQLADIDTIHDRALQLEAVNHKSHTLHELEMTIRKQAAYAHDFLITGAEKNVRNYHVSMKHLDSAMDEATGQGMDMSEIRKAVQDINRKAESIFLLPFATGNMEGPILVQEMDQKMVELSRSMNQRHHKMDDAVDDAMRFVSGLHLDMRDDFLFSLLVLFTLLAGLTAYLTVRVIRPLVALRAVVGRIGHGELSPDCPDFGDNEIGDLSRALNLMGEELKRQNEALAQARSLQAHQEKMHALGLMTASIAHEVGNPLSAASVALQIAAKRMGEGRLDDAQMQLKTGSDELGRTEGIIRNILEYGRETELDSIANVDLLMVIHSALQLVSLARKQRD